METFLQYKLDLKPETKWIFVSATSAARANFAFVQETGHFLTKQKYYLTRSGLDSYLLKITLSGGGILEYGGQTCKVKPGQFFWIDCNQWQHYATDPDYGEWDGIWVHFNGPTVPKYYNAFLKRTSGSPVAAIPENSPILKLLQRILNLYPSNDADLLDSMRFNLDIKASSLLTQLMSECVLSVSNSRGMSDMPAVIRSLWDFLTKHYNQKMTLESLAANVHLNPCYLQKLFKHYVGQSPTEFQIYLRITKAKMLMRTTDMPISEISYTVGIENISYFTRLFKKSEGVSPRKYRKLWPSI